MFCFWWKMTSSRNSRAQKVIVYRKWFNEKKVNGTECKTKSSSYTWKALVEMAKGFRFDCVEKNQNFPFLIFLFAFIFCFRLLFLAFRVKWKFYDFIVVFNAPNARWSKDVISKMQSDIVDVLSQSLLQLKQSLEAPLISDYTTFMINSQMFTYNSRSNSHTFSSKKCFRSNHISKYSGIVF